MIMKIDADTRYQSTYDSHEDQFNTFSVTVPL